VGSNPTPSAHSKLDLEVFADGGQVAAPLRLPDDPKVHRLVVDAQKPEFVEDPLDGRVRAVSRR
jgi:hypothetical protein